jgi:hypothetical protein
MTTSFDRPSDAAEKPRLNPLRVEIRQTLLSTGFRFMATTGLLPTVREWRNALVWNGDLEREDRIALQRAMALVYGAFKAAYTKAELDIPHWLSKEFEEADE